MFGENCFLLESLKKLVMDTLLWSAQSSETTPTKTCAQNSWSLLFLISLVLFTDFLAAMPVSR